ncbi:MAG: ZapG family protein [Gammaproteobacteria bacterium]
MLTLTAGELVALLILLPLLGAMLGFVFATDRMRKANGGRTPTEIRQELEDYKRAVAAHFQDSANIMEQMTEQYRSIYAHMAHGAAQLCDDGDQSEGLRELRRLSRALDETKRLQQSETEDDQGAVIYPDKG